MDTPNLSLVANVTTESSRIATKRTWGFYKCARCGGIVTAFSFIGDQTVLDYFPKTTTVDEALPPRARAYLQQAIDSKAAPVGAVMLAASAVDSMLKAKGYTAGTLYERIDKAAAEHVLTADMARWAHQVRLDANDQRHADEGAALPDDAAASLAIEFAQAMGQFLFVLPSRVSRGIAATGG